MANVRTRFAPSPTGYMHVGNLRTALYTYLQARHNGGTFILRIEDTDQGRLVEGATDIIYGTLKATGLTWDEGPDIGGPCRPLCPERAHGHVQAVCRAAGQGRQGVLLLLHRGAPERNARGPARCGRNDPLRRPLPPPVRRGSCRQAGRGRSLCHPPEDPRERRGGL